jgi:hypothetical protein
MAHKYEHISTGEGFKVKNGATTTAVIDQDGQLSTPSIKTIQETVTYDQFTDGGSTSGTFELSTDIPVGAIVMQSSIDSVTGFAGDTSCVLTIGDGTDADRYNTGTPNIFATAAAVSAGAVSGTAFHAAAKTPTLTATSGSDWGDVTAGSVTVTIFYYEAV